MRKKIIVTIAWAIAAVAALAWMFDWFGPGKYSADPKIAELEKLRDETIVKQEDRPMEERRAEGEQFRTKVEGLSEQQRQEFFERSMPVFIERASKDFNERYDKLMAMTPEERNKELDKAIDEMEKRRGAFEKLAQEGGGGGDGKRRGPPNMDPKKMDEMRKKMLDWTTPEMRGKFENSMQMMNDRRKERGLPPMNGPWGGGGPGGGMF